LSAELGIKREHEVFFFWCFNTEAPRAQLRKVFLSQYNVLYNRVGFLVVKVALGRDFLRLRRFLSSVLFCRSFIFIHPLTIGSI